MGENDQKTQQFKAIWVQKPQKTVRKKAFTCRNHKLIHKNKGYDNNKIICLYDFTNYEWY